MVTTSSHPPVTLRQLSASEALDVKSQRRPASGWAEDFPQAGDLAGVTPATFAPSSLGEPWYAPWFILENDLVVGMLGFKGEPLDNILEVGYGIVPSARGRGVATKALAQLLGLVRDRSFDVVAETALWNAKSQAVLGRLNFVEVARRYDFDDGDLIVWRWRVN